MRATRSMTRSQPQLLDLPTEVLETIFLHIKLYDRVSALPLVCKQLRDLSRTSATLAARVSFPDAFHPTPTSEERLGSLASWLEARAAAVRELDLAIVPPPDDTQARDRLWQLILHTLGAVAPTLTSLHLAWLGPQMQVGPWVAAMQRLEHADLVAPRLALAPGALSALPLRHLWLVGADISYSAAADQAPPSLLEPAPPGAGAAAGAPAAYLPPSLTSLSLERSQLRRLPPGLAQLSSLASLNLSHCHVPSEHVLDQLSQLGGGLQELQLSWCRLSRVPPQLSRLTGLRVLYLHDVFRHCPAPPPEHELHAALGRMPALGMLSLSSCRLERVPSVVVRMTSLLGLHLEDNSPGLQLPPGPYLSRLKELSIGWPTLLGSHRALAAATQLTRLYVCVEAGADAVAVQGGEAGGAAAGGGGEPAAGPPAGQGGGAPGGAAAAAGADHEPQAAQPQQQQPAAQATASAPALPGPPAAEVAASLAALPALQFFVDVCPSGRPNNPHPAASGVRAALQQRCPRLDIRDLDSQGFGWGLAELRLRLGGPPDCASGREARVS